ncbi:MAG: matrixin family metalloprotease, partial [Verrucomicrobiota bacterium]
MGYLRADSIEASGKRRLSGSSIHRALAMDGFAAELSRPMRQHERRTSWAGDPRFESGKGGAVLSEVSEAGRKKRYQSLAGNVRKDAFDLLLPVQQTMLLRLQERIDQGKPVADQLCFGPGSNDESTRLFRYAMGQVMASSDAYRARIQASQLTQRWSQTATDGVVGSEKRPLTVTWSIVPDGSDVAGFRGEPDGPSTLFQSLDQRFGNRDAWFRHFQEIFDQLSSQTGLTIVYEPNDDGLGFGTLPGERGIRGDIRVAGHPIDGPGGAVAYNFFPNSGDMVIDVTDRQIEESVTEPRLLRNILAHEFCHGLGLKHVCPIDQTKLMEAFLSTRFEGLQPDDLYSLQKLYGDGLENNDSVATASDIGVVGAGGLESSILSLDHSEDKDYLMFHTAEPNPTISVSVKPLGGSYPEGPEVSEGVCGSVTTFNAGSQRDLLFSLYGPSSGRLIGPVDEGGFGSAETVVRSLNSGTGPYFLLIEGDAADRLQLYTVELETLEGAGDIQIDGLKVVEESCLPANQAFDPGEIATLEFGMRNIGPRSWDNVSVRLEENSFLSAFPNELAVGSVPSSGTEIRGAFR